MFSAVFSREIFILNVGLLFVFWFPFRTLGALAPCLLAWRLSRHAVSIPMEKACPVLQFKIEFFQRCQPPPLLPYQLCSRSQISKGSVVRSHSKFASQ